MEMADVLHVIWIGTGRDTTGSLCLEFMEKEPTFFAWPTFDERLAALTQDIRHWCGLHGIRPSTIEDLSNLVKDLYSVHMLDFFMYQQDLLGSIAL